jgi:hypothetical protein
MASASRHNRIIHSYHSSKAGIQGLCTGVEWKWTANCHFLYLPTTYYLLLSNTGIRRCFQHYIAIAIAIAIYPISRLHPAAFDCHCAGLEKQLYFRRIDPNVFLE